LFVTAVARADVVQPQPWQIKHAVPDPPAKPKLAISYDRNATVASLVLPAKLTAALSPAAAPRVASTFPTAFIGLTLAGSLIAAGLWLGRQPRAKYAVGLMLPILAITLIAAAQAQPVRLNAPRAVIETGKLQLQRNGSDSCFRLILP